MKMSQNPKIEYTSSSENEDKENQHRTSPLNITNYSSDDGMTSNDSHQLRLRTPVYKRQKCTEKRLPLVAIKQKSITTMGEKVDESPPKVLTAINTFDANASIWRKLHTEFAKVEYSPNRRLLLATRNEETGIDADDEADNLSEAHIDECSSPDANRPSVSSQTFISTAAGPTELDLFLALIEQENKTAVAQQTQIQRKKRKKRCRKGGYVELLMRTLDTARMEAKFLEHDRKFGLQVGVQLEVLSMHVSFGVHLVGVCELMPQQQQQEDHGDNSKNLVVVSQNHQTPGHADISYYVVLNANMACNVQVGSKLEAFFNTDAHHSYWLKNATGKMEQYYIQPHKLLLLS